MKAKTRLQCKTVSSGVGHCPVLPLYPGPLKTGCTPRKVPVGEEVSKDNPTVSDRPDVPPDFERERVKMKDGRDKIKKGP